MKTFFRIFNNGLYGVQVENIGFPVTDPSYIPDAYLKKSQETFLSTSIFNKVNLHQSSLYYFNYLKQNKHIRKKTINVNSDANTFLNLKNNSLYLFDENNVNYHEWDRVGAVHFGKINL